MGLLPPALSRARSSARSAMNLANIRSLGQAAHQYLNDFNYLFPGRLPPGESHLKTGRNQARFIWFLGEYVGYPFNPVNEEERAIVRSGSAIPRLDNPVFMDPSHRLEDTGGANNVIDPCRNGSYGYNYKYLSNSRVDNPNPRFDNFPVNPSRIKTWDRTIVIANSLGNQNVFREQGVRGEHSYTLDPPRLDTRNTNSQRFAQSTGISPIEARHDGRAGVAFLDGHARTMTLAQLGYIVLDERGNQVAQDRGNNALFNGLGFDDDRTGP